MKMLQVIPNPYRVLDADGKPTAIVPCHSRHAPGEFVGATKTLIEIEPADFVDVKKVVGGKPVIDRKLAKFDRSKASFTFTMVPVQVPAEGVIGVYYRDRVRDGSLIAADQFTAQKCGMSFEAADKVLAKERDAAAKIFERQFGALPEWASNSQPAPTVAPK